MKNRVIKFYRSHVAGKSEATHTFFVAVGLILVGVTFVIFDINTVVLGNVDMNRHMPFMLPIIMWMFGGGLLYSLTFSSRALDEYQHRYSRYDEDK